MWLVAKEKEIGFELRDFLEKPPSFFANFEIFLEFLIFFEIFEFKKKIEFLSKSLQKDVKKLPPILSKSQQLYVIQQQKNKGQIDRKKNRESITIKGKNMIKNINIIQKTQKKEYFNDKKVNETEEVLNLFNSPNTIKSNSLHRINLTTTSLFSHKETIKTTPYDTKASFTKIKRPNIEESIRKEENGVIFTYNK